MTALNAYCRDCILFMQLQSLFNRSSRLCSELPPPSWVSSFIQGIMKNHIGGTKGSSKFKSFSTHKVERIIKTTGVFLGLKKSNTYKSFSIMYLCKIVYLWFKAERIGGIVQNLHSWLQFLELFWVGISFRFFRDLLPHQ